MRTVLALFLVVLLLPAAALAQTPADFGSIAVNARPPGADVFIDGERWVTPDPTKPITVHLSPGRHRVDVRMRGHQPFSTVVEVRTGETTPVNVTLPALSPADALPPRPEVPPPPPPSGVRQVSVGPSEDGFAFAPDFRVTSLHHDTAGIAGFYGGAVIGGRLMIGGGMYWELGTLYNHSPAYGYGYGYGNGYWNGLVYGGPVVEWRVWRNRTFSLAAHGLVGYGESPAGPVTIYGGRDFTTNVYPYGGREGFAVAEPELRFVARVARGVSLAVGGGYRFTSADRADLNGVIGSFSLQFGR